MYLTLKFIHIISSTLLFGTGLGTAFYMWRADRSGDPKVIAVVSKNVVLADYCFTLPAVIVQPLTGFAMLHLVGLSWEIPWVKWSLLLYVIIGCCWLPVVWIQTQVAKLASQAVSVNQPLPPAYRQLMKYWYGLGWPAFIAVLLIFYLMVVKQI